MKLIVDPFRLLILRVSGDLGEIAPGEVTLLQGEGQRHVPVRHLRQVKIVCVAGLFLDLSSLFVLKRKLDDAIKGAHRLGAVQGVFPAPGRHHLAIQSRKSTCPIMASTERVWGRVTVAISTVGLCRSSIWKAFRSTRVTWHRLTR